VVPFPENSLQPSTQQGIDVLGVFPVVQGLGGGLPCSLQAVHDCMARHTTSSLPQADVQV
jgi:hypothetical protein